MEVFIETYRTFDIVFDTENETFLGASDRFDSQTKERKTYSRVKADIDEYIKENLMFKPFVVQPLPGNYLGLKGNVTIVGIRKDGAFVYLNDQRKPTQLSSYDERKYAVYNPDNDRVLEEISIIEKRIDTLRKDVKILESMFVPGQSLEEIRKQYTV